ncbi:MAG: YidC/Oxa1 family membrane protein insertase, partial [Dehalococcoidia bacterium]
MDLIWDIIREFFGFFIDVMVNALIFLYGILGSNLGISIIAFTVIVRVAMYPLTRRQLRASKAMSQLQPKIREIQKKYPKDRARVSQETMRLYREEGVNPIGCLGPMVVQLPIMIGMYQAILRSLPRNPEGLVDLSQRLWSWVPGVHEAVPLNSGFLWLDLAEPDPSKVILPLMVGASMWVQQRMMSTTSTDPRQASMNRMMQWMMPVMFGAFTLGFPSGLALYWVVSNLIGIALQYRTSGWGRLIPAPAPVVQPPLTEE